MPILDDRSQEFLSHSTDQTRRAGMHLGALLEPGDVICLIGELGSGKTTLVQGISSGWGSLDQVTSPTFVLVNVYRRLDGARLFHLDAFRLNSASEAEALDIDEFIENGPLVVEWSDRIQSALPGNSMTITFQSIDEDQRDMMITAQGPRYQELLDRFRKQVFGVSR
jgi:tRNA threonylcarbamoyladenosine biosynthesis protein TsaE